MMIVRTVGSTGNSLLIYLLDSATNQPKTGVAYTDVTVSTLRAQSMTGYVSLTPLASGWVSHQPGGWFEYTQPGVYRLDLPNSVFIGGGSPEVMVHVAATGAYMLEPITICLLYDQQAGTDDIIDEITNLGASLPDESYIAGQHLATINQIRGGDDKTNSEVFGEAALARKCVGNTRQIVAATGVETIFDDDDTTPIRQISRSEPVSGTLREEVSTP